MAICPTCGKNISSPSRKIHNHYFTIEGYTCDQCGTEFKETR